MWLFVDEIRLMTNFKCFTGYVTFIKDSVIANTSWCTTTELYMLLTSCFAVIENVL